MVEDLSPVFLFYPWLTVLLARTCNSLSLSSLSQMWEQPLGAIGGTEQRLKAQNFDGTLFILYHHIFLSAFSIYLTSSFVLSLAEPFPLPHRHSGQWRSPDPWGSRRWCLEGVLWWNRPRNCGWICHALWHWIHLSGHDVRLPWGFGKWLLTPGVANEGIWQGGHDLSGVICSDSLLPSLSWLKWVYATKAKSICIKGVCLSVTQGEGICLCTPEFRDRKGQGHRRVQGQIFPNITGLSRQGMCAHVYVCDRQTFIDMPGCWRGYLL